MEQKDLDRQRRRVAKVALILVILVGIVALLSLTFRVPGDMGDSVLRVDFMSHPSMPVVFFLLFFLTCSRTGRQAGAVGASGS